MKKEGDTQFFSFNRIKYTILTFILIQVSFLNAQPVSNRPDITIRQLGTVSNNSLRITFDHSTGYLYTLQTNGDIKRVNFNTDSSGVTFTTVYQQSGHGLTGTLGMAFGPDGTLYVVGNSSNGQTGNSIGKIAKGVPVSLGSENITWSILVQTVEYNYGVDYNHRMSGVIVDPNNNYVYVNSGARTDHGEEREGGLREIPLTSLIFKLPVNGNNIILQNDWDSLLANGYVMADGIRNTFDFAYAGNGDLFGVENSGDRDDPEEMNWIQEGNHYGFPWRIGGNNTPQQFTPYDPMNDPLLNPLAYGGGDLYATFYNDTSYPSLPEGIIFTDPIMNSGLVGDKFRDTITGQVKDASALGLTITTFTPHRSVNGIVFDNDSVVIGDLKGGGFVISLAAGSTFQPFADTSQDLLHVSLTKVGDTIYTAEITRLVYGFNAPLGIEMVENKIYVMETGLWFPTNPSPKLYEITLPSGTVDIVEEKNLPNNFEIYQNSPNPFNPITNILFQIANSGFLSLRVYDVLGNEVATLVNEEKQPGIYEVKFNASALSSGIYFYKLNILGEASLTRKMLLMK